VPWIRLNDHSLIQLGHGRYQQRLQATITSRDAAHRRGAGFGKGRDQPHTRRPRPARAPPGAGVSLRRAIRAAERIGYPVVLKPLNANHGRGVTTDIHATRTQLEKAYDKAKEHSDGVIVETFLEGLDHRLLVVGGKLVAAAKRVPAHVVGDGQSTIEELVDTRQRGPAPRRRSREGADAHFPGRGGRAHARAARHDEQRPGAGEIVYLQPTANLSTGGTAVDVTDVIHPDNRVMAERAILGSVWMSGASTSLPRISPAPTATSVAASASAMPPRASACTWRPRKASRATSRVR
jgi:cyanophycin synthetase